MATSTLRKLSIATIGTAFITLGTVSTAEAGLINFDTDANGNPINAPSLFFDSTALTNLYAPLGVNFSGPGQLSGGSIIDQLGNFGVNALSGANFLAFNRGAILSNGGIPTDPETISFADPIIDFSIFASGGFVSNTFQVQAFDINNLLLGTSKINTAVGEWGQLNFSSSLGDVSKVVLTGTGAASFFVYDNLSFTPASKSVPEPGSLLGLVTFATFGATSLLKFKQQQKA
ncbi:PEP-CTERM sorting domain-containing protein [Nostoc sp. UCD121]|uniref:PEP-CTERM sorting domain-containing protein n=1 Tax=unclassified Nostoc TaxID=2593658 RepID=UPI001625093C|nr:MULTISPECIES: PEP-CTERM sorting domain-containing protein [unclassified Nostoc]MBC1223912.1 PEP-CTERM sorting domain-containing protein [Nostoc sp. UCD120]MBC1279999.1 PEP-CTERM sorting domain-containing protein [Nostoc sp. UCD121]MBC1296838.1 PEP-CTERM sorting domain-containing protein [Nostoc sp. UCD122]